MDTKADRQMAAFGQNVPLRLIDILIEKNENSCLAEFEIKYVLETLCIVAGVPWRFLPAGFEGDVHIYYGNRPRPNAGLVIQMETEKGKQPQRKLITGKDGTVFLDFFGNSSDDPLEYSSDGRLRRISNDIIYTAFDLLTGVGEIGVPRDRWEIHDVRETFLYKNKLLHVPIVDHYAQLLKNAFSDRLSFLPKWPDGKKIAVMLSHDTDYPEMLRPIEMLRYTVQQKRVDLKKLSEIWTGAETFWKFDDWMHLEESFQTRSAFYLCPFKGSLLRYFFIAPDTFYDIRKKKYKDIANRLHRHGFEVGLHASFFAHKSLKAFKGEKDKLERILQVPVAGNRHHYWRLNHDDPSTTAVIHEKAGLLYDSSMAFDRHSGFRYSVCTPYHLYSKPDKRGLSILQLPPTLMDDQLFGAASLTSFANYREHIDHLVKVIYQYEGLFVADFHTRVLNETFFPEWGSAYRYMLEKLTEHRDFYNDTPENIARYWLHREQLLKAASINESSHSYQ